MLFCKFFLISQNVLAGKIISIKRTYRFILKWNKLTIFTKALSVSAKEVTVGGGVSLTAVIQYSSGVLIFITVLYIILLLIWRRRMKSQLKASHQNKENKDVYK